jgi:hypothetical protein
MRRCFLTLLPLVLPLALQAAAAESIDPFTSKPRLVVLSDIGNEPDDQMSLVRLLVYANELDIEALVATTSTWQKNKTMPETMRALVAAYGQVRHNLLLHASGWPDATQLAQRIYTGQPAYGMADTGIGRTSPGAQAIIDAADRAAIANDPRPLWVSVWGGANTLAQALITVRATRSPAALAEFVSQLRVYAISDQDDAGPWIRREFPDLFYIAHPSTQRAEDYYYATWTGISGDVFYRNCSGADGSTVTNEWLDRHIRSKGPLGKMYPRFEYIMEGDTPAFLGLVNNGLASFRRPDWGGWGGRYFFRQPNGETRAFWTQGGDLSSRITSQDTVIGIDGHSQSTDQATIWRWRQHFQHDFAARMSWTIAPASQSNHHPLVVVNANSGKDVIELEARPGQKLILKTTGSQDPDGHSLRYHWFHYPEAGTTNTPRADITLGASFEPTLTITANAACTAAWKPLRQPCTGTGEAHIILAVTDTGTPSLTSYRRILLRVKQ